MKLQGSIMQIKTRVSASGDKINVLSLEAHGRESLPNAPLGSIKDLHDLVKQPLEITLEIDEGPFVS